MRSRYNYSLQPTVIPLRGLPAAELKRCRGRFAPHNHADQADSRRKSLRLSHLARLIRRPVSDSVTRLT